MRIVVVSDTHNMHDRIEIPDGDVLVHCGDCLGHGTLDELHALDRFLGKLPHPHKILIAGNHDWCFEREPDAARRLVRSATYLQDEAVELESPQPERSASASEFSGGKSFGAAPEHLIPSKEPESGRLRSEQTRRLPQRAQSSGGLARATSAGALQRMSGPRGPNRRLNLYGSPWQPWFYDWAFNLERGEPLRKVWAQIPNDTDVLITHGPPYGILDRTVSGEPVGCEELMKRVEVVKPKLHLFGHIHEGYGMVERDDTTFVNASTCTVRYAPTNAAVILDL